MSTIQKIKCLMNQTTCTQIHTNCLVRKATPSKYKKKKKKKPTKDVEKINP